MLDSLQIKNFRIFQDLRLEKLGRVNLIVGKNSSGKSCLLEALRVYGHSGNPWLLYDLVRARNEDLDSLAEHSSTTREIEVGDFEPRWALLDPIRNLFHGYQMPSDFQQGIEIGPVQGGSRLRLSLRAYTKYHNNEGRIIQRNMGLTSWEEVALTSHSGESGVYISLVGELCDDSGVKEVSSVRLDLHTLRQHFVPGGDDVRFVPVNQMDENEMVRLWDKIVIRPRLREHVVNALRLVDPRIQEIVMLQSTGRDGGPVPILLYDEETRLPLKSLGDGVSHLFHMILATVSARGGMVLFDEFENGLHWSVQSLVWKTMFELAVNLDLQIFATTHSWDCVQAFKDVALEHQAEAMLFHLGRSVRTSDKGKIIVTEYDKENLDLATRAGLEVR